MRRKHLARLGRAPANGNCHRRDDPPVAPPSRELAPRPGGPADVHADVHTDADPDADGTDPDRPGFHRGVPCPSCARKAAAARQHQDRQLWILARELCASATLYGLVGRAPVALRTLKLACTMLRDRTGASDPAAPRD
jgi:hypothetical protein